MSGGKVFQVVQVQRIYKQISNMSDSQDLVRLLLEQESPLQSDQSITVIMSEFLNAIHAFAADERLSGRVF
jgi:hypothetical protein